MNKLEGSDILTWLKNWISPEGNQEDEANLERQMADDPFLADAMEGYRGFPKKDHVAALSRVRTKMNPSSQRRNVGILLLMRVAAGVLLLVGAFSGFYFLGSNGSGPLTEQTESQALDGARSGEAPRQIETPADQTTDQAGDTKITTPTVAERDNDGNDLIALKEDAKANPAQKQKDQAGIQSIESLEAKKLSSRQAESAEDDIPAPDVSSDFFSLEGSDFNKPASPTPPKELKYVVGVVQDEIGAPIIGASVVVPGTDVGTTTGVDGRFSLKWDNNYTSLQFNYLGFTSQTRNVSGPDTLKVVLNGSSVAMNEVSAEKPEKRASAQRSTPSAQNIMATPSGGFRKFDRYLKKNLKKPAVNITGSVRLQFTVHPDGSLSNFKVLQSLCASCDEEAIRLMRNGPEWKVEEGEQPVIQTYTIPFD